MANPEEKSVANVNVGGDHAHAESSSVNQRRWPDDVVNFLNLVKSTYGSEPETYRQFLRMMGDYKNFRISADCLIVKVHLLFKDHKELLNGFNHFVPREYKGCNEFNFEEVVEFVNKIKLCFSHDPNVFEAFLLVLSKYMEGIYDVADSFREVCKLFEDHPDLIIEYRKYLPPIISVQSQPTATQIPSPVSVAASSNTRVEDGINYLQKVKETYRHQLDTYRDLLVILKDYKCQRIDASMTVSEVRDLLQGNHELIKGFNIFLPEEYRMDNKMLVEYDRATDIINLIKSRFRYDLCMIRPFIEVLDWYSSDTMSFEDFYTEVMALLENHPNLLDELRVPILMAYLSVGTSAKIFLS